MSEIKSCTHPHLLEVECADFTPEHAGDIAYAYLWCPDCGWDSRNMPIDINGYETADDIPF